ncbi:MAG: acetolactate synthase small subunit [Bacillota bacterium]
MEDLKVITLFVKNKFGVLTRVSNVFSRRGINIKQFTAAETTTESVSRLTILTNNEDIDFVQFNKQLERIEDVLKATVVSYGETIGKEILLVRIRYTPENLEEIQEKLIDNSGKIISFDMECIVGQVVGRIRRIDRFIESIREYEIIEMSRSGVTALAKEYDMNEMY